MGITRKDMIRLIGGSALGVAAGVSAAGTGSAVAAGRRRTDGPVIRRDVCVLGGGSSGTYTAVRLRDHGLSVAVVETQDRLGGHTETYHDPATGGTIDIGVIVFHDTQVVRDHFARFDVPLSPFAGAQLQRAYVDLRTGRPVDGYTPPAPALPAYLEQLQRHAYLRDGFVLPDPVPADLLSPFGEFVTRYGLETVVPMVSQFGQGLGDILRMPTLYVMLNFGIDVVTSILNNSFVTTTRRDNGELYERATAYLGEDVLLGSRAVSVRRDRNGVRVQLDTPDGPRTVHCDKLVVTFPPTRQALAGFDLDPRERSLFAQFQAKAYWTAVARLRGLPDGLGIVNAGADTAYHLPALPGCYSVLPTAVPSLYNVKYGSDRQLTAARVRADITGELRAVAAAGTFPIELDGLEVLKSHSPFELHVDAPTIAAGFYRDLYGLQGRNRTYYNGAAFVTHDSGVIWRFTEGLLPAIIG